MKIYDNSWQAKAKAKVAAVQAKIPSEWLLKQADLESAKKQRKLCGQFFEKFLDDHDLGIIRNDSLQLVDKIRCQQYTAVTVTRSYCKAAAVAQQNVSPCHETIFLTVN